VSSVTTKHSKQKNKKKAKNTKNWTSTIFSAKKTVFHVNIRPHTFVNSPQTQKKLEALGDGRWNSKFWLLKPGHSAQVLLSESRGDMSTGEPPKQQENYFS
jgi:hypothetical protein